MRSILVGSQQQNAVFGTRFFIQDLQFGILSAKHYTPNRDEFAEAQTFIQLRPASEDSQSLEIDFQREVKGDLKGCFCISRTGSKPLRVGFPPNAHE